MKNRILVVDNEPDTVELIRTILASAKYGVSTAFSGLECLEKVEREKPELVLLDLMMPDLSGWDTFNRIRRKNMKVKIAFISVIEVSRDRKEKLLLNGLSDYITKPFTAEELLERVGKILA